MKKNKFLSLVICLLLGSMLLCSCGGTKTPKAQDVFSGTFESDKSLYAKSIPISVDATKVSSVGGKFITFCKAAKELTEEEKAALGSNFTRDLDVYTVYNIENNSAIANFKSTMKQTVNDTAGIGDQITTSMKDVSYASVNGYGLFTMVTSERAIHVVAQQEGDPEVTETITVTTTLYDESGKAIDKWSDTVKKSADEPDVEPKSMQIQTTNSDLFLFNEVCYRVNADGTGYEKIFDTDLKQISSDFLYYTDEYYYTKKNNTVNVYDRNLALLSSYTLPSYAQAVLNTEFVWPMADGNLFIQYLIPLSFDAKDYDLYNEDGKYNLVTEIFDVKKGTSKTVKADYVIAQLTPVYSGDKFVNHNDKWKMYTNRVENFVEYTMVENKSLNLTSADVKFGSMNGKGKIQFCLSDIFVNMEGVPQMVAADRMIYRTVTGQKFLANTNGEVLGEVTAMEAVTKKCIISNRKLYDHDLNEIFDYTASGMTLYDYTEETVFFEKSGAIYIYDSGSSVREMIKANSKVVLTVESNYYVVSEVVGAGENAKTAYTYYSASGKVLGQSDMSLELVASYEGVAIFGGYDSKSEKMKYYWFTI